MVQSSNLTITILIFLLWNKGKKDKNKKQNKTKQDKTKQNKKQTKQNNNNKKKKNNNNEVNILIMFRLALWWSILTLQHYLVRGSDMTSSKFWISVHFNVSLTVA